MSRIGKNPIVLPEAVKTEFNDHTLTVKGPKGALTLKIHNRIILDVNEKEVVVKPKNPKGDRDRVLWGTFRSLIQNMVDGVVKGYEKKLEIIGIGFRANLAGQKIILQVGYSHPIEFELPQGIQAKIDNNIITLTGIDKQLVGEIAAQIRRIRKPEPYKGKGIRYVGEIVRKKAGKAAKTVGA